MAVEQIIAGTVRQGVVVPKANARLPEGKQVRIVVPEESSVTEADIWQQAREES